MSYAIKIEYPPNSPMSQFRKTMTLTASQRRHFDNNYLNSIDMNQGFIPNVVTYCINNYLIPNHLPVVFTKATYDNLHNGKWIDIMYKSMQSMDGPTNFLVITDDNTCELINLNYNNQLSRYEIDPTTTFRRVDSKTQN